MEVAASSRQGKQQMQHFTLQQVVAAPLLSQPVRLPECLSTHNITKWLAPAMRELLGSKTYVQTELVQVMAPCFSKHIANTLMLVLLKRLHHAA